jgi:hypothetical protein
MKIINVSKRKTLSALGISSFLALPSQWSSPLINVVALPAHAQTSTLQGLCEGGVSTWIMSEYQENGVDFDQGNPQTQVQISITDNQISLVTDWFVINSNTSAESRGRVTDVGTIDLSTGQSSTSPSGSPVVSPTHGGVTNLANSLNQTFTLDCANSGSFVVRDTSNVYSFRLTRV